MLNTTTYIQNIQHSQEARQSLNQGTGQGQYENQQDTEYQEDGPNKLPRAAKNLGSIWVQKVEQTNHTQPGFTPHMPYNQSVATALLALLSNKSK